MRFSTVQMTALVLALGVSAAPSLGRRDCDLDIPSNSTIPRPTGAFGTGRFKAAATNTKKSKTKTTKTKTTATDEATAIAAEPTDSADATTTAESTASATDSPDTEPTDSASEPVATASATDSPDAEPTESASDPVTTAKPTATSGSGSSSGGGVPASSGTSTLAAAQTIAAGESFDGGMVMFDRGVSCTGQAEGGDSDAVFIIENGGSISNVIIGPNQIEGIHCNGACTVTNVWWTAVCEDAFTIKEQDASETTKIIGGGAFGAEDKVLQHNGAGTLDVSGFTVGSFGKLYRACGNCASSFERHVIMSDITGSDGDIVAGINSNFGDTATITNSAFTGVTDICVTFEGVEKGSEPTEIGSGNDGVNCIYGSDVTST